jgi:hypothetical protein
MRIMTDAAVVRVQAMNPAPVFRASAEFASACRPVSGQECFGSAAAAWQVESASGAVLAGAAGFLGLIALGEGLLERHGYVGLLGQERPRPVFQPVPASLTELGLELGLNLGLGLGDEQPGNGSGISERGVYSDNDSSDNDSSDNDSSKGDNGTKPMTLWDFRTSSPPG